MSTKLRDKIDVVLNTIDLFTKEKYGYALKKSSNEVKETQDIAMIIKNVTTMNRASVETDIIKSILMYKKAYKELEPISLSVNEVEALNELIFEIFSKSPYTLKDLTKENQEKLVKALSDVAKILRFKSIDTYAFTGNDYKKTEIFKKNVAPYINSVLSSILGEMNTNKGSKSTAKDKNKIEVIFKFILKSAITDVEKNGFIIYKKRELLNLMEDANVKNKLANVKSSKDLTNEVIHSLDQFIKSKLIYKAHKFTSTEHKIINKVIIKVYNELVGKYGFNLTGNDIAVDILKSTKKIKDLREVKTPLNYKDLVGFEKSIYTLISQGAENLFEENKPKQEVRTRNYAEVLAEVKAMIDNVCKFNFTDEIIFKEISAYVSKLSTPKVASVAGIDGVEISKDAMTALISYNNGTGLFLVNPYVIIEVYKKRIVEDKTGQLHFEDAQRLDKNGAVISKFLSTNIAPLLKKRNKLNILTKPISYTDDAKRLTSLINATRTKNPELVNMFKKCKLTFNPETDDLGRINRLRVTINGNRNLLINPEFIYDIELNKFYFIRETPNAVLAGIRESAFKGNNVKGVPSVTIDLLNAILNQTFDLRKSLG